MGEKWEDQFYKSSNSVKPMYSADDLRLSREPTTSPSLKRRRGGKESWSFDGCQLNCARFCGPANRPAGRPLNTPMWSPITHFLVTSPIPKYFYQRQNITFEFSLKRKKGVVFILCGQEELATWGLRVEEKALRQSGSYLCLVLDDKLLKLSFPTNHPLHQRN